MDATNLMALAADRGVTFDAGLRERIAAGVESVAVESARHTAQPSGETAVIARLAGERGQVRLVIAGNADGVDVTAA